MYNNNQSITLNIPQPYKRWSGFECVQDVINGDSKPHMHLSRYGRESSRQLNLLHWNMMNRNCLAQIDSEERRGREILLGFQKGGDKLKEEDDGFPLLCIHF